MIFRLPLPRRADSPSLRAFQKSRNAASNLMQMRCETSGLAVGAGPCVATMETLNQTIMRVALARARTLVAQGVSPQEAARRATPGSWATLRPEVLRALSADVGPHKPDSANDRD